MISLYLACDLMPGWLSYSS